MEEMEHSTKERNNDWDDICDNYQLETESKHLGEDPHYQQRKPRERKDVLNQRFSQEYLHRQKMNKDRLDSFKPNIPFVDENSYLLIIIIIIII